MEKDNLDNLFKERLTDFSEAPDPRVWERLEQSLDKKKKKRILPIWWQLGGVAAALVIVLFLINPFASTTADNLPQVADTEKTKPEGTTTGSEANQYNNNMGETPGNNNSVNNAVVNQNNADNPIDHTPTDHQQQNTPKTNLANTAKNTNKNTKGLAVQDAVKKPFKGGAKNKIIPTQKAQDNKAVLALNTSQKDAGLTANTNRQSHVGEQVAENQTTVNQDKQPNETAATAIASNKENTDKDGISIYDAIAAKDQDQVADKAAAKRWALGPAIAPVFYSSLGEGSPIHSNFASNSKSGNLNMSYGLSVSYQVNKKLRIKSGVHKVDFGYDTNDIVFNPAFSADADPQIDNIDYNLSARSVVVHNKNQMTEDQIAAATIENRARPLEGSMVQQLGYIEVPVEFNYAVLDKRFGVHLIGGMSSLFLVDNTVSLASADLVTEVGEANNANAINFSTNVGVGLNYLISDKLRFNVEPIFKYQLNTFTNSAGNFKPYAIGVYSGLNFRF